MSVTGIGVLQFLIINALIGDFKTDHTDCLSNQPADYCNFVFKRFIECCTDDVNPNCKEIDEIFKWKDRYYVINKKYIWPLEGFTSNGYPILHNPSKETNEVTDPGFFPGIGNVVVRGYIQSVLVFNDKMYITLRRSIMKNLVDVFISEDLGERVKEMNQEAGRVHDLFKAQFIEKYLIRSVMTFSMVTKTGVQNVAAAFLPIQKKKIDTVALFDSEGKLLDKRTGLHLKTCASVVYADDPDKSKLKYIAFHIDGYMCRFEREYSDNSLLLDKSYKGSLNCIFCMPIHSILGCPQPFCLRTDVDDFTSRKDTDMDSGKIIHYVFRGPYFWQFTANSLPLPFPRRTNAKLIKTRSPWADSPSHIDAAFSLQFLTLEVTYFFKENKFYKYVDLLTTIFDAPIYNEFKSENLRSVDTAMYLPKEHLLLLFHGDSVHLFQAEFAGQTIKWSKPHIVSIKNNFTGLPSNVDATIQISDNSAIITKDNFYYKIDPSNWDTSKTQTVYTSEISFSLNNGDGLFDAADECAEVYPSDKTQFATLLRVFKPKGSESMSSMKHDDEGSTGGVAAKHDIDDSDDDDKDKVFNKYKYIFIVISFISLVIIIAILFLFVRNYNVKRVEKSPVPETANVQTSSKMPPISKKGKISDKQLKRQQIKVIGKK
ncbi:matrix metalloproteinase-19-like isoform X2 [Leptotrombidium deliense]|uniref:Matrix metalloproteinase-19-like isoform X2 n=1 Tax=Leptotrombidium deliense TaxID=299467 RepID=A0A443S9N1_9ACAR|nr:matrix metalloproteinase-19-like isoform X2 [Leptotrombidium deliense]